MSTWAVTLDDLERQLDDLEAALEQGTPFGHRIGGVPRGLGALPDDLHERAAAVHRRMRTLEQIVQLELEHTRQLLVLGSTANDGPARPVMFDRRG